MAESYMKNDVKTEPNSPHGVHHVSSRSSSAQNSEIEKDSSDSDLEIKSNNSLSYKERRREAHTQVCTLKLLRIKVFLINKSL
jgi:hypothetical protein